MWPRLLLREGGRRGDGPAEEPILVETRGAGTRGAGAGPGDSAWQTVLQQMAGCASGSVELALSGESCWDRVGISYSSAGRLGM